MYYWHTLSRPIVDHPDSLFHFEFLAFRVMVLFHLIIAVIAIKPAVALIDRMGKSRAYAVSILLSMLSFMSLSLALLNNAYSLSMFVLFNFIYGLSTAVGNVASYSLLSDVSDFGTLKTGIDRSATCFSMYSLCLKTCTAIGISLSIALAGYFGFDPVKDSQGESVYWGLLLCMSVIPSILCLLSAAFIAPIGITAHRHKLIRKRLDARAIRAQKYQEGAVNV